MRRRGALDQGIRGSDADLVLCSSAKLRLKRYVLYDDR